MFWPDPDVLPLNPGILLRFTPRPEGDVDGFVLEDAAGPARHPAGGDANAVAAWTERHIFGTWPEANRNGQGVTPSDGLPTAIAVRRHPGCAVARALAQSDVSADPVGPCFSVLPSAFADCQAREQATTAV